MDEDGSIGRAEFESGVNILNHHHLPKDQQILDPDKLFAAFDKDGDGTINMQDFRQVLSHSALLSTLCNKQMDTLKENHEMLRAAFNYLGTSTTCRLLLFAGQNAWFLTSALSLAVQIVMVREQ